jgi:hypothetical protein
MADIEALSFPRMVGSEGQQRAVDTIQSRLERIGLTSSLEPFEFSVIPMRIGSPMAVIIVAGIVLGGALLLSVYPALSIVLAACALLFIPVVSHWSRLAERLFDLPCRKGSVNIVAEIPARETKRAVILTAHHDSKSQRLPIGVRLCVILLGAPLAVIVAFAVIGAAAAALAWGAQETVCRILWIASLVPLASGLLLLCSGAGNRSPGALDNATGCAVLLEVARRLQKEPVEGTDVKLVFTGAEEMGLVGAMRYAQAHEAELDPESTVVVNIDSVGCGPRIGVVDRYGIPPVKTSRTLARALVKKHPDAGIMYIPVGVGVDSFPFGFRGIESISLVSRTVRTITAIHTPNDTVDRLDSGAVERAADLCMAVVCNILH